MESAPVVLTVVPDWTNEESLAAAVRNSRQNRQNAGARIQSFIVPSECGHLGIWTFGWDLSDLCAYLCWFFSTGLVNEQYVRDKHGIWTEVRVKENCLSFVHRVEFASEDGSQSPFIDIFTCGYNEAIAQCRMEEKKGVIRWVRTAVFFVIVITLYNFSSFFI